MKDSVNLLVFGSSRANHHINTELIDSLSFNMGVNGTRLGYSSVLISTLKKKNQTILVHVDPNILFSENYEAKDILSLKNWAPRIESIENNIYELYPQDINISYFLKSYLYNGKVLGIIKNYFKPGYDVTKYYGYDPIHPTDEQRQIFEKILSKTNKEALTLDLKSEEVNPLMDKFIRNIKKKCYNNKSRLLFFTSPTCKILSNDLKVKAEKYFKLNDINYKDYSTYIDTGNLEYWKDLTHMSHKGASMFSKKLLEDISNSFFNY
ncbi:hypothetical protein [Seonamhaeicola marinus]|uniref:SGNH/GDSL hydrolase family protein n=1 Tax=Seonamhaeicola marinus TaxID=1912246 RepID=A0A5D0HP78_9FLAO|nr:hypothetical protein [Seonamhaeicola marinus]TYA71877.1 hypothetical protein FUA24_20215 [Seonamhaeicola marinus]